MQLRWWSIQSLDDLFLIRYMCVAAAPSQLIVLRFRFHFQLWIMVNLKHMEIFPHSAAFPIIWMHCQNAFQRSCFDRKSPKILNPSVRLDWPSNPRLEIPTIIITIIIAAAAIISFTVITSHICIPSDFLILSCIIYAFCCHCYSYYLIVIAFTYSLLYDWYPGYVYDLWSFINKSILNYFIDFMIWFRIVVPEQAKELKWVMGKQGSRILSQQIRNQHTEKWGRGSCQMR